MEYSEGERERERERESLSLSLSLFRALNIPAAADTYRYKITRDPGNVVEGMTWFEGSEQLIILDSGGKSSERGN